LEDVVRLPLLDSVLPGGLRYGANYLVEFEPQSLWFETSLTLCAQALRAGIRTDYRTFTHPPADIRRHLGRIVPDLAKLEDDETFRIVDSYTVQTGMGAARRVGKSETVEWVDLKSVKMDDWDKGSITTMKKEVPAVDKRRFHVDDDTSVLLQYNDERRVTEHFRTITVPFARHLELAAVHSVAAGIYSESFYRQFESFCDGLWDFKVKEEGNRIEQYMRLRFVRGANHDSSWKRIGLVRTGEVSMSPGESRELTVNPNLKSAENLVSFLGNHDELDLSKYSVAGSYLRFDETTRNLLKDLCQKIVASFDSRADKHENILLWAPPGTGKTHFVRQITSSLEGAVLFSEVNLAEASEDEFRSRISENVESGRPTLCLVDEIDSKGNEIWPYEALLASLDADPKGPRHVYVMTGSFGGSLDEMKERMSARPKGPDLLSRIPQGNEYSVPSMSGLDNVLVFLAAFTKEAGRTGKHVDEVEKFGLYYVAESPHLANARRMREFSIRCADRVPRGESRLKYDNMFDAGDPANKEFWARESSEVSPLMNSYLRVRSLGPTEETEGDRRLAAIMFTDTVGFTATTQRDEALAMTLLGEQRALMRPFFAKYRGREVKTIGDAFLVEFASALEGVKCAVEIQEALRAINIKRPDDRKILVRIGIHLGDVLHTGTDVAGDAVNVASRLEPLAPPGGVCVSGQVYESMANKVHYRFESLGRPRLKNVSSQVDVYVLAGFGQKGLLPRPSCQRTG
jgi:class 3 adenylate cyclase/KaiC/GvpD/RAD55 family RecA-like ATPase